MSRNKNFHQFKFIFKTGGNLQEEEKKTIILKILIESGDKWKKDNACFPKISDNTN